MLGCKAPPRSSGQVLTFLHHVTLNVSAEGFAPTARVLYVVLALIASPRSVPPSEQPSREQDWIAGLHAGDHATFEAVFRAYYPRLAVVVRAYVRSKETAADLVQQLFLAIWHRHQTLEISESLQSYLFRAARNAAFNHLRRADAVRDARPQGCGSGRARSSLESVHWMMLD